MLAAAVALSTVVLSGYLQRDADAFVGAQHWWESGWYATGGLKEHYDGYFCLCSCNATEEGVFCKGGGVHPDKTPVATFLAVFSQERDSTWLGRLATYDTGSPFVDTFTQLTPGGPANYTGVSQAQGSGSFVWRGYMGGVDCQHHTYCDGYCNSSAQYTKWSRGCP
eukprot:TRINITY_DN36903_c0_g1_i1.p1 TRINITY_DN36903_c0_g1~~TRINITY_DN36903_c0_g1_i1.p1  ORF type:complete len:181 (+),score=68.28 TRINITY_DN36903_c0_g1_i1:46-543(+)